MRTTARLPAMLAVSLNAIYSLPGIQDMHTHFAWVPTAEPGRMSNLLTQIHRLWWASYERRVTTTDELRPDRRICIYGRRTRVGGLHGGRNGFLINRQDDNSLLSHFHVPHRERWELMLSTYFYLTPYSPTTALTAAPHCLLSHNPTKCVSKHILRLIMWVQVYPST